MINTDKQIPKHDTDMTDKISYCNHCNCMTKEICGKCKKLKVADSKPLKSEEQVLIDFFKESMLLIDKVLTDAKNKYPELFIDNDK